MPKTRSIYVTDPRLHPDATEFRPMPLPNPPPPDIDGVENISQILHYKNGDYVNVLALVRKGSITLGDNTLPTYKLYIYSPNNEKIIGQFSPDYKNLYTWHFDAIDGSSRTWAGTIVDTPWRLFRRHGNFIDESVPVPDVLSVSKRVKQVSPDETAESIIVVINDVSRGDIIRTKTIEISNMSFSNSITTPRQTYLLFYEGFDSFINGRYTKYQNDPNFLNKSLQEIIPQEYSAINTVHTKSNLDGYIKALHADRSFSTATEAMNYCLNEIPNPNAEINLSLPKLFDTDPIFRFKPFAYGSVERQKKASIYNFYKNMTLARPAIFKTAPLGEAGIPYKITDNGTENTYSPEYRIVFGNYAAVDSYSFNIKYEKIGRSYLEVSPIYSFQEPSKAVMLMAEDPARFSPTLKNNPNWLFDGPIRNTEHFNSYTRFINFRGNKALEPAVTHRYPWSSIPDSQGTLSSASCQISLEALETEFNFQPMSYEIGTANLRVKTLSSYEKYRVNARRLYGSTTNSQRRSYYSVLRLETDDAISLINTSDFTVTCRPGDSRFKMHVVPVGKFSRYNALRFWNGISPIRVEFSKMTWIPENTNLFFRNFFNDGLIRASELRGEYDHRIVTKNPDPVPTDYNAAIAYEHYGVKGETKEEEIRYDFGETSVVIKFDNIHGGGAPSLKYKGRSKELPFTPFTDFDTYHMFHWWFSKENWWDLIVRYIYFNTQEQALRNSNSYLDNSLVDVNRLLSIEDVIGERFLVYRLSVLNFSTLADKLVSTEEQDDQWDNSTYNWSSESESGDRATITTGRVVHVPQELPYQQEIPSSKRGYRFYQDVIYNSNTETFHSINRRKESALVYNYNRTTMFRPIDAYSFYRSDPADGLWSRVQYIPTYSPMMAADNQGGIRGDQSAASENPNLLVVPSIYVALPTQVSFSGKATTEPHGKCNVRIISQDILNYNVVNKIITFEDSQNCFAVCSKLDNLQNSKNILHKIRD